jgi:IclR family mhp operon transcriptional activator
MKGHDLQTLQRGLRALEYLNYRGPTSVTELARHLTVSRPTAYRLLETLVTEGYSGKIPGTRKYRVMPAVRRLSQSINDDDVLTAVALDPIFRLAAEIKWPVTLVTPSATSMLVRLTTDFASPLALTRIPAGARVPMLQTTTGILYLSLVDAKARAALLRDAADQMSGELPWTKEATLKQLLESAALNKYLILEWPLVREANIGVPILDGDRPIGGIVMRYIKSAMKHDDLVHQFLPKLRALSEEIVVKYHRYKDDISLDFDMESAPDATL